MDNELVPGSGRAKPPLPPKEPVISRAMEKDDADEKKMNTGDETKAAKQKSSDSSDEKPKLSKAEMEKRRAAKKARMKRDADALSAAAEDDDDGGMDDMDDDSGSSAAMPSQMQDQLLKDTLAAEAQAVKEVEKETAVKKAKEAAKDNKSKGKKDSEPSTGDDKTDAPLAADIDAVLEDDDDENLSPGKQLDKDERMDRNARRILSSIARAMPTIAPNLRLKGSRDRVAHELKIPYLDKFAGMIQPSYVIVPGSKERFLYFACLNHSLFDVLKNILATDVELREQLCADTVKIQFGCPKVGKGLLFKKISKGFLRGKRTAMYTFDLKKDEKPKA